MISTYSFISGSLSLSIVCMFTILYCYYESARGSASCSTQHQPSTKHEKKKASRVHFRYRDLFPMRKTWLGLFHLAISHCRPTISVFMWWGTHSRNGRKGCGFDVTVSKPDTYGLIAISLTLLLTLHRCKDTLHQAWIFTYPSDFFLAHFMSVWYGSFGEYAYFFFYRFLTPAFDYFSSGYRISIQ